MSLEMESSFDTSQPQARGRGHPVTVQDSARCWATRNHFRVVLANPAGATAIGHPGKCSPDPAGIERGAERKEAAAGFLGYSLSFF